MQMPRRGFLMFGGLAGFLGVFTRQEAGPRTSSTPCAILHEELKPGVRLVRFVDAERIATEGYALPYNRGEEILRELLAIASSEEFVVDLLIRDSSGKLMQKIHDPLVLALLYRFHKAVCELGGSVVIRGVYFLNGEVFEQINNNVGCVYMDGSEGNPLDDYEVYQDEICLMGELRPA